MLTKLPLWAKIAIGIAAGLLLAFASLAIWASIQFHTHPTTSNGYTCTKAHIYLPERLSFHGCKTVTGRIVIFKQEPDGDYHAELALDWQYLPLLRPANWSRKNGHLIIEDVCYFPPSKEVAESSCQNFRSPFGSPAIGQRYEITGNYVYDRLHGGWAELHGLAELKPIP